MTLLVHLVRYELRRLWLWPLAWLLLQLPAVCVLLNPSFRTGAFQTATTFGHGLGLFWVYLVVIELWVEAPPLGVDRFWASRPISPLQALASRLLSAGLLVWVFPALFYVPCWLLWGMQMDELRAALANVLGNHTWWLCAGLLVGVCNPRLSRDGSRFVHSVFALVVFGVGVGNYMYWIGERSLGTSIRVHGATGYVALAGLFGVFLSVSLLYLRRTRVLAVLVLTTCLGLGCWAAYTYSRVDRPMALSQGARDALGVIDTNSVEVFRTAGNSLQFKARRSAFGTGDVDVQFSVATLFQGSARHAVTASLLSQRWKVESAARDASAPSPDIASGQSQGSTSPAQSPAMRVSVPADAGVVPDPALLFGFVHWQYSAELGAFCGFAPQKPPPDLGGSMTLSGRGRVSQRITDLPVEIAFPALGTGLHEVRGLPGWTVKMTHGKNPSEAVVSAYGPVRRQVSAPFVTSECKMSVRTGPGQVGRAWNSSQWMSHLFGVSCVVESCEVKLEHREEASAASPVQGTSGQLRLSFVRTLEWGDIEFNLTIPPMTALAAQAQP